LRPHKLNELERSARAEQFEPFTFAPDSELADKRLSEYGCSGTKILERGFARRGRDFSDFRMFWFAGYGSSQFARDVVRYVFEKNIEYHDCMEQNSPLKHTIRWFALKRESECSLLDDMFQSHSSW